MGKTEDRMKAQVDQDNTMSNHEALPTLNVAKRYPIIKPMPLIKSPNVMVKIRSKLAE